MMLLLCFGQSSLGCNSKCTLDNFLQKVSAKSLDYQLEYKQKTQNQDHPSALVVMLDLQPCGCLMFIPYLLHSDGLDENLLLTRHKTAQTKP